MTQGLVIVTGGSCGIGAAICRRLAQDGYAVAVNYTARPDAANSVDFLPVVKRSMTG